MKKLLLIFLACGFLFVCVSGVQAIPLEVGHEVWYTSYGADVDGLGAGGEFAFQSDHGYQWTSFCVELHQTISSSHHQITGLTKTTTTKSPLTAGAAWLFWNFATNSQSFDYDFGKREKDQTDLQALIWLFQGEILTDISADSRGTSYDDWKLGATNADTSYIDKVNIVNLGTSQDQLVLAPVPEPATMVLFGIGLLGLAGIGRKRTQR